MLGSQLDRGYPGLGALAMLQLAPEVQRLIQDLTDAAPEYIVSPRTSAALLESFRSLYPKAMKSLPHLRFIEQYDPSDTSASALSQPYAYVADKVEICKLNLDITDIMVKGIAKDGWDALMDLKDNLARDAKLGWWVVYNGDEARSHTSDCSTARVSLIIFSAVNHLLTRVRTRFKLVKGGR